MRKQGLFVNGIVNDVARHTRDSNNTVHASTNGREEEENTVFSPGSEVSAVC